MIARFDEVKTRLNAYFLGQSMSKILFKIDPRINHKYSAQVSYFIRYICV
jgi:hypothetical protein